MEIAQIYEKITEDPLNVTEKELWHVVNTDEEIFQNLRSLTLRVFDMNEKSLLEASDATKGFLGRCNRISSSVRINQYNRKIKRSLKKPNNHRVLIVAEGDSWFQFPIFIKDVIDWLGEYNRNYVIYPIAYGGDWMTNIIFDGKYIEELSVHRPDVFLISGGGNDLVGSNRLALMVHNKRPGRGYPKYTSIDQIRPYSSGTLLEPDKEEILEAQDFITKEFYAFITILKLQYMKIVTSINKKYPDTIIVSNGYDYAFPSYSMKFSLRYPLKSLINWFVGTGKWLIRPMLIKGIPEENDIRRKIIKAFIYELNIMLDDLAKQRACFNFYRAHTAGLFRKHEDWFDELHLKSHNFKKVAAIFGTLIDTEIANKRSAASTAPSPVLKGLKKAMEGVEGPVDKAAKEFNVEPAVQKVYTVEDVEKKG